MSRSGGVASWLAANRAAGPSATAAVPVRRKSRRETIAAGRVFGFVMAVLSRRQVRRVQPLLPPGGDGVTQGSGFRRLLPGGGQHVVDPLIVVAAAVLIVDLRRVAVPDHVALDPLAVGLRVGVKAPPRPAAADAVDQVAADHVL